MYRSSRSHVPEPMRRLALVCLLFLGSAGLYAQVSELGITVGATYYIGDLNPTRHYPKSTKPAFGAVYRYNFSDRYAVRFQGITGMLEAYDANSKDTLQLIRNLAFRARLIEFSVVAEVNFRKYRSKDKDSKRWTPFMFAGLAYFHAAPQGLLNGTWYNLADLGTEGQGTTVGSAGTYPVDHMSIPFGAGLKVNAGRFDFQLEWGLRRTWSDHIDDVGGTYVDQDLLAYENGPLAASLADPSLADKGYTKAGMARGDVNTRDWYQYTGLGITYIITRFSDCDEQYNWMRKRR